MPPLSEGQWAFFLHVAERLVPAVSALDPESRSRFTAIVSRALAARPAAIRRRLAVFLAVVRWAPLLRWLAPFDRLAPERQDAVLRAFMDAPVAGLRAGVWGLRALAFMGYYGQPEVWPTLGYAPSVAGNERLHA